MATGIRDKVAILVWGAPASERDGRLPARNLIIEAFQEALADRGSKKRKSRRPGSDPHR